MGDSSCGSVEMNLTRNHQVVSSIPGLDQLVKDRHCCELWCRPAATAPIRPLSWEPPFAAGAVLKTQKGKKAKTNKKPPKTMVIRV